MGERRYEFLPNWKKVRAQNNNKQRGKNMKMKIRGLVFVGFAAAVFAQSAMAANPSYQTSANTVTSKKYVDEKFQPFADRVEIGTGTGQYASTSVDDFPWTANDKYPSMKVLKEVNDAVAGIHGDTNYIEVTDDANGLKQVGIITNNLGTTADIYGNTNTTRLVTVGAVNGLLDTGISGTETDNTVPTSLAVQTYAEATANKLAEDSNALGTTTITQANATGTNGNTTFPTTRNVYDFVKAENAAYQPKVADNTHTKIYVGRDDGTSGATWGELSGATNGYVAFTGDSNGNYTVDIDGNKIADQSSEIVTSSSDLATAGAVYDFVNGNYQPKTTTQGVMTGYNGTWHTLSGDSTYITVADSGSAASVTLGNLTAHGVAGGGGTTGVDPYTSDFVAGETKLARSGDVYDFVMDKLGNLEIPDMPSECTTAAASGHYCALVYGVTSGTAGQSGATYGLMWTIMAPES